jgi:hypothetical protein
MSFKTNFIVLGEGIGIIALMLGGMYLSLWFYTIEPKIFKIIVGIALSLLGILTLIYGDKNLEINVGRIGRIFFNQKAIFHSARMKMVKWALGLVLIVLGMNLLF